MNEALALKDKVKSHLIRNGVEIEPENKKVEDLTGKKHFVIKLIRNNKVIREVTSLTNLRPTEHFPERLPTDSIVLYLMT